MSFSRWLLMFVMLFSLGWQGSGHAAASKPSISITGTWYNLQGTTLTFKANGTINYHGKKYYYAVSNGGMLQLKGKHGEMTIPYQLVSGKLTLTVNGKARLYSRRR